MASVRLLLIALVALGLSLEVSSHRKPKPKHQSSSSNGSSNAYNNATTDDPMTTTMDTTLPNQPELTTTDEPETSTTDGAGAGLTTTPIPGPPPPTSAAPSPPPTFPPTNANNLFFTTASASTGQGRNQAYEPAFCTVEFYDTSLWDTDGGCSGAVSHTEVLESSVGFTSQTCNVFEPVHTVGTTLYMTIQPLCKVDNNDPNEPLRWNICSWRPHTQADQIICTSLGLDCCEYLDRSIIGSQSVDGFPIPNEELACQEYEEDVCYPVFGRNIGASSVTQYALKLINCTGNLNPNPQCQSSNPLTTMEDKSWLSKFGKIHAMTVVGTVLIILAGLMSYRRHTRKKNQIQADEFTALLNMSPILDGPKDNSVIHNSNDGVGEAVSELAPMLA